MILIPRTMAEESASFPPSYETIAETGNADRPHPGHADLPIGIRANPQ